MAKRALDVLASAVGLIILSPIIVIIALLIKLDSPGPVFYHGTRMGKDWKTFKMLKFRSMVANAEKAGPDTHERDPRITRIGRFLRKTKLDELPQLINVFFGEMSLVGPRPEVVDRANMYSDEERIVYTAKPGITDYASLWNAHEEEIVAGAQNFEESKKIYFEKVRPEKVRLQIKYVKEMSLATDIKIILLTIKKIIFKK